MPNINYRAIAFAMAAIIVLMTLSGFYFVVETGTRGVVLRFGAVNRVEAEGIHLKMPFIEKVVNMTVRVQKETTKTEAASKDLQSVTLLSCSISTSTRRRQVTCTGSWELITGKKLSTRW